MDKKLEMFKEAIKKLKKAGADFVDIYYQKGKGFNATLEDNKIESTSFSVNEGVGVRVIKNFKIYFGYTNDLNNFPKLIESLKESLRENKDISLNFTKKERNLNDFYLDFDINLPLEEKIDILRFCNEKIREKYEKISQVTLSIKDGLSEVLIVNSLGEIVEDKRPFVLFKVLCVAKDLHNLQTGYESLAFRGGYKSIDKKKFLESSFKAAQRACTLLKAKDAPAGKFTVVLASEAGGTIIHEAVGHGLEADLVFQNMSVYKDKLGEKVAKEFITVIDDGTLKGFFGTTAFDDEGTPTQKTVLIENGILKDFMIDKFWSFKLKEDKEFLSQISLTPAEKEYIKNVQSSGNGRRQSYAHVPIPRMRNTFIAPGKENPEDIIKDTKKGILVLKMGGGEVNTVTGDFMFEINEAYMIENGKVTYPIKGASLIGNGPKILMEIDALGNDLSFIPGICGKEGQGVPVTDGVPTLRIPSITVGGTN